MNNIFKIYTVFTFSLIISFVSANTIKEAKNWYNLKRYDEAYVILNGLEKNAETKYYLALLYGKGKGVKHNVAKAVKLFKEAANDNFAPAQFFLGIAYLNGSVVKESTSIGLYYLLLSEKNNYIEAKSAINNVKKILTETELKDAFKLFKNCPRNFTECF